MVTLTVSLTRAIHAVLFGGTLIISGCAIDPASVDSGGRSTREDAMGHWTEPIRKSLALCQRLDSELHRRLAECELYGYRLDMSEEEDALWWVTSLPVERQSVRQMTSVRMRLRKQLLSLWLASGFGDPIASYPQERFELHADQITSEYREWLECSASQERPDVLRESLFATVDLLGTEFRHTAHCVLSKWVELGHLNIECSSIDPSVHTLRYVDGLSDFTQKRIAEVVWCPSEARFTVPCCPKTQ